MRIKKEGACTDRGPPQEVQKWTIFPKHGRRESIDRSTDICRYLPFMFVYSKYRYESCLICLYFYLHLTDKL